MNLARPVKGVNLLLPKHHHLADLRNRGLQTMGHTHVDTNFIVQIGGARVQLRQLAQDRE